MHAGREVTSKRIVEIYDQYGRGEQARDYRVLRYRALGGNDDAQPKGVVVASSGFDQRAEDGSTASKRPDDRGFQPHRRIPRPFHLIFRT